jgi:raffinose/stachyose/melibiose transport system substrate-binding protein
MKKFISIILLVLLVVALLMGCSSSSSGTSNSTNSSDTSASDSAKAVELTMMYNGTATDPTLGVLEAIVDDFNANNTVNAKLALQAYENEQYKTKLTTLMAANSVPDIFFTWELDYLRPFVEAGKVYEIGKLLDADQAWKDSFQSGVFDPVTYDGKIYAVPHAKSICVMFYNKKIFKDNNLTVPTTYEELLNTCQTLKDKGITPIAMSAPDAWIPAQLVQQVADGIGGMEIYNGLFDGSVKWNDPAYIEAGKEVQDMVNKGFFPDGFLGMKSANATQLFKDGKTAMYFMGCWDIATVTDKATSSIVDNVGAFALPAKNPQYNNILVGSIDQSLAISANSKNPEAAAAFIKLFGSQKYQEEFLYKTGRLPTTNIDIDKTKVSSVTADVLDISSKVVGLTPWMDRAFGAGEGVEFNNKCQAIVGGKDPVSEFNALQKFAETNASK